MPAQVEEAYGAGYRKREKRAAASRSEPRKRMPSLCSQSARPPVDAGSVAIVFHNVGAESGSGSTFGRLGVGCGVTDGVGVGLMVG